MPCGHVCSLNSQNCPLYLQNLVRAQEAKILEEKAAKIKDWVTVKLREVSWNMEVLWIKKYKHLLKQNVSFIFLIFCRWKQRTSSWRRQTWSRLSRSSYCKTSFRVNIVSFLFSFLLPFVFAYVCIYLTVLLSALLERPMSPAVVPSSPLHPPSCPGTPPAQEEAWRLTGSRITNYTGISSYFFHVYSWNSLKKCWLIV